jgi:hypothetical protein
LIQLQAFVFSFAVMDLDSHYHVTMETTSMAMDAVKIAK